MNKRAVVSFANKSGNYMKGLARLSDSLRNNFSGDLVAFTNEATIGSQPHSEWPYEFKVHAIKKAIRAGYSSVLWLDASCFAVGNIDHLFDKIDQEGVIFQDSGHMLGTWTNDNTLAYFGINRDDAMSMRMIGNAGFLGFNIKNYVGDMFFHRWEKAMSEGYFLGKWDNLNHTESQDDRCLGHRHDMSCSSLVMHELDLDSLMIPGDQVLQYAGPYDKVLNETIVIKAQGL